MAAPTRVTASASALNVGTTPKSVTVSANSGDLIVVRSLNENATDTLAAPTATGLTFTQQGLLGTANTSTRAGIWTATAAATTSYTIQQTQGTSSSWWGFVVSVWRNHGGVGNVGTLPNTTGTVTTGSSIPLTTSGANSGIDFVAGDFAAKSAGATRSYRSVNGSAATEDSYFNNTSHYTAYFAYHPDAGAAGSVTVGTTAPASQVADGIAIEILAAGGGGTTFTQTVSASCAASATVVRQPQLVRAAAAAASAVVVRQANLIRAASSAASAVVVKQAQLRRSASAACSATVATLKVLLLTVAASCASSATVSRVASHVLTLAATAAATATLAKGVALTRLTTVGDQASVTPVGPGSTTAAPPGQRPTMGVG